MYSPENRSRSKKTGKKRRKSASNSSKTASAGKRSQAKVTGNQKSAQKNMAVRNKKPTSLAKKRRKKIKWGRLGVVLLVAIALGYGFAWFIRNGFNQMITSIKFDYQQITQKTSALPYSQKAYNNLSNQLQKYLSKQSGIYGVYGIDISTGAHFAYNNQKVFTSANESMLPVVMTLYSDIIAHTVTASKIVHYQSSDTQAGPGFIGGMPYGTSFTVLQLARASIVQNDIVARNMLIRTLGYDQINSLLTGMGIHRNFTPPYDVTPQDLSIEMGYLYQMYQSHPQTMQPLISMLESNSDQGRLAKGVPTGVTTAQLSANWPNQYHDTALILFPSHPIALTICSYGTQEPVASAVEGQAAKLVTNFIQSGGRN